MKFAALDRAPQNRLALWRRVSHIFTVRKQKENATHCVRRTAVGMGMVAKTNAAAVANFILECAAEDGYAVRHLKLQKIVYFCYAWYAGNYHEELFGEDIEAWQFGPVIRELYIQFKDCGSAPIHKRATRTDWESGQEVEPVIEDQALKDDLREVWSLYRDVPDSALVEETHRNTEPWGLLTKKYGTQQKRKIPYDLIERVYSAKVAQIDAQAHPAAD